MASLLFLHRRRAAEEKPMVGGDIKFPESDLMIYGDLSFDDLLDFSCGDDEDDLSEPLSCPSWEDPYFHPPPPPTPTTTTATHGAQDHGLPCDDLEVAQLEWLSHFVEDSFSSGAGEAVVKVEIGGGGGGSYRTPSPVSVLEQSNRRQLWPSPSSSSSGLATARGPRTKRPRPAAFNSLLPFAPPKGDAAAEEERAAKRTKVKKLKTVMATAAEPSQLPAANGARRCTHCEIQKTPQWRAGPMGPKTLCNACGVRYKSGRLFPEYRPAASPTFVSAMHSNSHKKVVEMRSRMCPVTVAFAPVALKGCELINYIRGGNSGDDDGGGRVDDGLER